MGKNYKIDICKNCGVEFEKKHKRHYFCCDRCKGQYKHKNAPLVELICVNCKKSFQRKEYNSDRYQNSYCCLDCEKEYKHKQAYEFRICEICGESYETKKTSTQKMCSIQCQGKWQSINLVGKNANGYNPEYSDEDRVIMCEWCGKPKTVSPHRKEEARFCSAQCRKDWHREVFSQSPEWKEERSLFAVKSLEAGNVSKVNTGCQIIINNILDELKINYQNEKGFVYFCVDNYLIDSNLIIEVMGTYWHCDSRFYPTIRYEHQKNRIKMDKIKKNTIMNQHNINILYLWEDDINKFPEMCKSLILKYIENNGILDNYHSFNYKTENENLSLSNTIISPYMDWEIEDVNKIVDLSLKEKMCKKQLDKWITFSCDVCGEPREELISHYNKQVNHYCSRECKNVAGTNAYKNSKKNIDSLCDVC